MHSSSERMEALAEAGGKLSSGSHGGTAEERRRVAGKSEIVENQRAGRGRGVIQPSTFCVLGTWKVALTVILTKVARRKTGVFRRPTRNVVGYIVFPTVFPLSVLTVISDFHR